MRPPCPYRSGLAALAGWLLATIAGFAGGGPYNTLVVVNTNSADSVELGTYYAGRHGIPARQICRLGLATNLATVTSNEFRSWLLAPITNYLATNSLSGRIDYVVLCWDFPTRVRDVEGVTPGLFYGFKNAPGYFEAPAGCKLPAYTANAYYRAERAFHSADGWNATNGFIAFHLIASNLPTAKLVADRGAAAQASFPPATFYLANLGDQARGVREQLFADTQFSFLSLPGIAASCVLVPYYQLLSGKTNVIGYQDGYSYIESTIRNNNTWLPGVCADILTSYSGMVAGFTNVTSQSTVLDWMGIGATASYGTVQEPCAYLEKFADPRMAFLYARGFTAGEAYYMAVAAPYQGLLAGDPLAAPFAAPPVLSVTSQVPYQIVTGTVPLQVTATARSNGVPAAGLDLYVDDVFHANLADLAPANGNRLAVTVNGRTNTATFGGATDTLCEGVAALAEAVNADTNQIVSATAYGDRLELIYKQFNRDGDYVPVSAATATGTASSLTLGVGLAATNLVPSIYPARKMVYLYANPFSAGANAGDTITNIITLTNGVAVTNTLVCTQGESVRNILERFMAVVNSNSTLMATNGVRYDRLAKEAYLVTYYGSLFARTPGPDGTGIQVEFRVYPVNPASGLVTNYNFTAFMQDNPDDTRARASILFHVRPTNDVLAATTNFNTATLADGLHTFDFVARDGSAVEAQSRTTLPLYVCNSSPQLALLGTNAAVVTNGEPAALAPGTDFGRVPWAQPRTNLFSLQNNGTAALTITNCTTNGPGAAAFQVSGVPAVIAAGGVSNFTVVFAPATAGVYQAALAFNSDALLPQTNLLLAGTYGQCTLAIASAHGTTTPLPGSYTNWYNTVLTNSVAVPPDTGGTQLVCTGWALPGNDPVAGGTTNFTLTLTNDAVLTWLWTTNFWLDTETGAHGTVNVADAWQPGGAATQITATADAYYHFTNWTGAAATTNNPLSLFMDAPKTVTAHFAENLAASNTPEWWLTQFGWTNDFDAVATNDIEPDGFPTWQEYIADTAPDDGDSFPRMSGLQTWPTNPPTVTWPASTGRVYQIHYCDDLVIGQWTVTQLGLGANTWSDTNPPPATNRYYRISPQLP